MVCNDNGTGCIAQKHPHSVHDPKNPFEIFILANIIEEIGVSFIQIRELGFQRQLPTHSRKPVNGDEVTRRRFLFTRDLLHSLLEVLNDGRALMLLRMKIEQAVPQNVANAKSLAIKSALKRHKSAYSVAGEIYDIPDSRSMGRFLLGATVPSSLAFSALSSFPAFKSDLAV